MRILVTGATSGIGKQLALDYRAEGHDVWAVGRNAEALAQLGAKGISTGQVDLTQREESLAYFASLDAVDLAILNAGICEYVDLPEFDSRLFARVVRANLESIAISIEGILPLLRKGVRPQLVGMGSSAAYLPLPRAEAYGASKAAVAYLMDTLRISLAKDAIDVTLVCPGFVKTPLTDRNDFPMPFRISVSEASKYIRKGIACRKLEIHFPKRFTFVLKVLTLVPRAIWFRLAKRMFKK